MILGSPARQVKTLSDEESARLKEPAQRYVRNANRFRDHLIPSGSGREDDETALIDLITGGPLARPRPSPFNKATFRRTYSCTPTTGLCKEKGDER
jgi:hypothetical protein